MWGAALRALPALLNTLLKAAGAIFAYRAGRQSAEAEIHEKNARIAADQLRAAADRPRGRDELSDRLRGGIF